MGTLIRCYRCNKWLDHSSFTRDKTQEKRGNRSSRCRPCNLLYMKDLRLRERLNMPLVVGGSYKGATRRTLSGKGHTENERREIAKDKLRGKFNDSTRAAMRERERLDNPYRFMLETKLASSLRRTKRIRLALAAIPDHKPLASREDLLK